MGSNKTRQFKIEWMMRNVNAARKAGKTISTIKLFAIFALECQSTERTGKEIYNLLLHAGRL